ncbi:hypothetical protein Pfo_007504 [Paulownia fortunei]|nr:hypothetical protein Pfo_007504 [Paulownia fortunei]
MLVMLQNFHTFREWSKSFCIFGSKRKHESTGTVEEKHTSGNDQIKHEGGSNTEEENSLDNSIGALPVSSLHVPLLHGSLSSGHTIKDDNIGSSETVESHKTGDHPEITPPHASVPSGDVAIDIGDGIDGTSEGVTATTKPESELREEQSAKSQRRPGNHQVKHQGKDNNHKYGKTGFCASQITKITLRERKTGRQFSVYYR